MNSARFAREFSYFAHFFLVSRKLTAPKNSDPPSVLKTQSSETLKSTRWSKSSFGSKAGKAPSRVAFDWNKQNLIWFVSFSSKTSRFHVAVRLFSNKSQKRSKWGKNIIDIIGYRLSRVHLLSRICGMTGFEFSTDTPRGSKFFEGLSFRDSHFFFLLSFLNQRRHMTTL